MLSLSVTSRKWLPELTSYAIVSVGRLRDWAIETLRTDLLESQSSQVATRVFAIGRLKLGEIRDCFLRQPMLPQEFSRLRLKQQVLCMLTRKLIVLQQEVTRLGD